MAPSYRILIINPNTSHSMTDALREPVEGLNYNNTTYTFFTAPSGPSSINNPADAALSTEESLPALKLLLASHDAFLVACYSPHSLVSALRAELRKPSFFPEEVAIPGGKEKPVLGILEASVAAALQVVDEERGEGFGIVSTGKVWEGVLGGKVGRMLGGGGGGGGDGDGDGDRQRGSFVGVETTGLSAGELHDAPVEEVKRKVQEAVGRLQKKAELRGGRDGGGGGIIGGGGGGDEGERGKLKAVLLGCAGMAGMEDWVREVVGRDDDGDGDVKVVDGVLAGVAALQGLLRCKF